MTMTRRSGLVWSLFLSLFWTLAALGCSDDSVGRSSQAVGNGADDAGNLFNYVGAISQNARSLPFCSGTLVASRYVISANHCFVPRRTPLGISGTNDVDNNFFVTLDFDALNPPPASIFQHTFAASDRIPVQFDQIDETSENDAAHDVAVVKLDLPVPARLAKPLRPAGIGGTGPCGASFDGGLLIGYGGKTPPPFVVTSNGRRNFNNSDGWQRIDEDPGYFVFSNFFIVPPGINYAGALPVDSGGALLSPTRDRLCGVTSRFGPASTGFPFFLSEIRSDSAGVDDAGNRAFLANALINPKTGNFRDECQAAHPERDKDNDGFPDECDNCPNVSNDQMDSDGDGVGDRCDDCRLNKNPRLSGAPLDWNASVPNQQDSNFRFEVQANGGKLPPTPTTDNELTDKFPGDVCDPNPLTLSTQSFASYQEPRSGRTIPCTTHFIGECPAGTKDLRSNSCPLPRHNMVHADTFVGESVLAPTPPSIPTQAGLSRMGSCACIFDNFDDCKDSFAQCDLNDGATQAAGWRPMTLGDPSTKSRLTFVENPRRLPSPSSGLLETTHTNLAGVPATANEWGWAYWATNDLMSALPPVTPDAITTIFHGFVGSWVKTFRAAGLGTSFGDPTGTTAEQTRRQYVAPMVVTEDSSTLFNQRCPDRFGLIRSVDFAFCPMCTNFGFLQINRGDPADLRFVAPGIGETSAAGRLSPAIVGEILDPANLFLPASDEPGYAGGAVAAVILNRALHGIVDTLRSDGHGGLVRVGGSNNALPSDPPDLIAALSGHRQELAFFGEPLRPTPPGQVPRTADFRVFDFDLRQVTVHPLLGKVSVGAPVAATYRVHDDAYYLLERSAGHPTKMRLLRIGLGLVPEVIAEWPKTREFAEYALTTGSGGSLVISASTTHDHCIAVLDLKNRHGRKPRNEVTLRAKFTGPNPIAVAAYESRNGLSFGARLPDGSVVPVSQALNHEASERHHGDDDRGERGGQNEEHGASSTGRGHEHDGESAARRGQDQSDEQDEAETEVGGPPCL